MGNLALMHAPAKHVPVHLAPEPSNTHRVCVAVPAALLAEAQREAVRLDRSLSWIFQQAWRVARARVGKLPAADISGVGPSPARPSRSGPRRS